MTDKNLLRFCASSCDNCRFRHLLLKTVRIQAFVGFSRRKEIIFLSLYGTIGCSFKFILKVGIGAPRITDHESAISI
jgi:hypothetical protein